MDECSFVFDDTSTVIFLIVFFLGVNLHFSMHFLGLAGMLEEFLII